MSRKQKKSAEEKVKIIRQYLRGEISITQVAELGGVDWETAKQWIRNYESEGVSAFLPHKNKAYSPEIKHKAVGIASADPQSFFALHGTTACVKEVVVVTNLRT